MEHNDRTNVRLSPNWRRKPTTDNLEEMEKKLIFQRGRVTTAENIASLREHPGWEEVRSVIKSKIKLIDSHIESLKDFTGDKLIISEDELKLMLKERKVLLFVVSMIDDFSDALPNMKLCSISSP